MKFQRVSKTFGIYAAIVAGMVLGTTSAHAGNWYVGLGLGQSNLDGAEDVLLGTGNLEDSDTGYKLSVGYEFNQYFAIDVAYVDLGTFSGSLSVPGLGVVSDNWEANGLAFSGVVSIPLGERFSLFGKLGFTSWKVEDTIALGASSATEDASGTDVNYGFGAAVDFNERFGMNLEYEFYTGLGDEVTNLEEGADVSMLSLNAVIKF